MKIGDVIAVNDTMQRGYEYVLSAPTGAVFSVAFKPDFAPSEMLEMGVFEGKYCNDCLGELPSEWFANAKTSPQPDPKLNYA